MLKGKGFVFESETDTEVIPKLAKYLYDRRVAELADESAAKEGMTGDVAAGGVCEGPSFHSVVSEVVEALEGAYALVFKSLHFPGELVACRRGSPLILGIKVQGASDTPTASTLASMNASSVYSQGNSNKPAEYFFASDASAVVEHTKSVLYLEDDDVAHVCLGRYHVYRVDRDHPSGPTRAPTHDRVVQTLQMEVHQIMKGGYDHFMQKEIHEQPQSLIGTMRGRGGPRFLSSFC
eukprot:CAMPEP_0196599112 /NCGR_PEP_ID=MMETSP1081-20130531/94687_1 /TAXON_ID=36882 /ORGANISM="Pyramimonas amylifera, Strain CCMP720" /LENGTH=235 /DNA_ID=CAMNT_0041924867 /DNA_START=787 /DNA_END=1494 /DNA_ORIENTATION=-